MKMNPVLIRSVDEACNKLRGGEVVAIPTETVYGLAADATDDRAVAKIYEFKNRPKFNPLIVHVADLNQANQYVELNDTVKRLAESLWPGALTFVLPLKKGSPISLLCSAGLPTLAVRAPSHPVAQELLRKLERPFAAPSANPSMHLSPTSSDHVMAAFKNRDLSVLEGGDCRLGLESTILDLSSKLPAILRYGSITKSQIEEALGEPCLDHTNPDVIKSPGQLLKHYAPSKPLRMDVESPDQGEGYLGFGRFAKGAYNLSRGSDMCEAAANLFKMLHQLDQNSCEAIAVAPIPNEGVGIAINDRLRRAARPKK